jgi:hypothetical protein
MQCVNTRLEEVVFNNISVQVKDWDRDHNNQHYHDDFLRSSLCNFLADLGLLIFELLFYVIVFEEFDRPESVDGVTRCYSVKLILFFIIVKSLFNRSVLYRTCFDRVIV